MAGARGRGFNVNYAFPPCHRGGGGGPAFVKEPITQQDFQKLKRRRGDGPRMELRLLVRGRNAGAIIGRNGSNIKRIRQEFKVNLFLTDTQSPERILSIMGDLGSICETILDLIPVIDNNPPSDVTDDVDVRILMHQSQTGIVVGRKGQGIRELRTSCNARVKVYGDCCPRSTDRVVQINGGPVDIVNCIATIVDLVIVVPPMGLILPYNPNNFVEIKALEYGGFTGYDVMMPFQGETVLRGPDGRLLSPKMEATVKMEGGPGGSGFDGGQSHLPGQNMQSSSSFGQVAPPFQQNNFSPSSYDSPGFRGGPGIGSRGQGPYGRGDMGRGHMNQGPRTHGWGSTVQYPIGRGYSGNMGQSPVGYGGSGGSHPMGPGGGGSHPMGPADQGAYGQTSKDGSMGQQNRSSSGKVPLDQCPGLSFHPLDARTVQVGIPKPLQTVVMGRRGTAIRDIRLESKAKIVIEVPPAGATERFLTLSGTPEQLQKAQYLLQMRYLDGKKRYTEDPEAFMNRGQRKRSHPDAPWMTDEIMKMKLMRRKLERVWRGAKTEETKKDFKDYCLEMNKAIRKVKEEYYLIHGGGPEKKKSKPKLDADGNEIPEDKNNEGNSSQEEDDAGFGDSHSSDEDISQDAGKASSAAGDLKTELGDGCNITSSVS